MRGVGRTGIATTGSACLPMGAVRKDGRLEEGGRRNCGLLGVGGWNHFLVAAAAAAGAGFAGHLIVTRKDRWVGGGEATG